MRVMHLLRVESPVEPVIPSSLAERVSSLAVDPVGVMGVPDLLVTEFFLSEEWSQEGDHEGQSGGRTLAVL